MKKHKWIKKSESIQTCNKCNVMRFKVRKIYGGWEYFDMKKIQKDIGIFTRPECI